MFIGKFWGLGILLIGFCGCSGVYLLQLFFFFDVGIMYQLDFGDGIYCNLILYIDYFDLDVVVVGNDYYMIVFSFNFVFGLFVLYFIDLVNWMLINYVLFVQVLVDYYVWL